MNLKEVLHNHGITTLREFTKRAGLGRQQAWEMWHNKAGVGKAMAIRLHETLGIPFDDLMKVDPVPYRKPRKPKATKAAKGKGKRAEG